MSQHHSLCNSFRLLIHTHDPESVIHTFHTCVSHCGWDSHDIIQMLHSAKGISPEIDEILEEHIGMEICDFSIQSIK